MKETITIFRAKQGYDKFPVSPYGDNTFIFESYSVERHDQMYAILVSHFVLNIPISKLKEPIRTYRRKVNLEKFYDENITYLILDIDDVKTEKAKSEILKYFKDYKVILGESKSYNGISNFNLKGILFTEPIKLQDAKAAISSIHHDLREFCTVDESVSRKASLNAPIRKNKILLNNENGKRFNFIKAETQERINEIKKEYIGESFVIDIENLQNITADSIEKLCLKVFLSMGFNAITNNKNGSISFKHDSEKKSPGGYFWFSNSPFTMHHFNSTKSINIFDSVRKLDSAKELMKKDIDYNDEFLYFNTDTNVISVDEKFLKITDEINTAIQNFIVQKDGLFSIRSPMGTGKSTIINHIIEECNENDMQVLIITNRISVAKDFGKKYNIKIYNEDMYNNGDSLVCQYDSLWKYNIRNFDIIIMDEFISLLIHSRNNLNNNSMNAIKFFAAFNKKLVIADAFLTGYENFLIQDKTENLYLIDNTYRDPTVLYSYDNQNYFVDSLVYHSSKHKITVSATSLSFINSLELLLKKRGLKVITLTAQTPESTKNVIYELFEKTEHDKWDVLIFSPTLTVGVSNLNNVNYHFHYDSSMSTDVISSIQMIKRTRKSKEIHLFVKDRINYIKTSYNDIRDEYMSNLGRNIEQNYLFDIDDYGEARLSDVGKKAIKIDTFKNILEFNHKKAMFWLLKYHFMKEPRLIDTKFNGNILTPYQNQIKHDNQLALMNSIEQFLALNDIQKTDIILDGNADKTMRVLAEIDEEIKDAPSMIKARILENSLKDRLFIQKCKFYRVAFSFTKKIWDETDVQSLVSRAVINGNKDDLHFYNVLLSIGQNEISDEYKPKTINANSKLKYVLDKCGYKITKLNDPGVIGHRGYCVDKNVKELYWYIK